MLPKFRLLTVVLFAVGMNLSLANEGHSQTIQLPSVGFFNVRTVVSAPDGGAIQLGGINRHSSGRISRGTPLINGIPGAGRLFGNRAIGGNVSGGRATVHPRLIIMSELEAEVMAEAKRRQQAAAAQDPNGPAKVQEEADFITRNIGRNGKR